MNAPEPLKKQPREVSARMGDLATLPVFLKLKGKPVLVAGGSAGTAWKAELLAAAGAEVQLVWAEPDAEAVRLAAEWPDRVTLIRRALQDSDFDGVAVAIGAMEKDADGAAFSARARGKGIPVNVVDKPAFCDFQFGAIVNRSPLIIGISTDGGAPPLGQAIRSMIETLLPAGLSGWAAAAKTWRSHVMRAGLAGADRKTFWRRFARMALERPNDVPCPVEREAMLVDLEYGRTAEDTGHLALIGAGPGDPELLTLKAVRFLREADVILYDALVGDGILAFARREARKIQVGKRGGHTSCAQQDITALAVDLAKQGHRVVRLKGGDPLIFGRADEEIAAATEAGIGFTLVNGVSAALGAAASLGVSLTKRGIARRLQFVTAHDETGAIPHSIHWPSIADRDATTCVYMGRRLVGAFLAQAMTAGLSKETPACFVSNATMPDEHILHGTAGSIAGCITASPVAGPGVLILGEVLQPMDNLDGIEGFNNPSSRHPVLDDLSPIRYEKKHHALT
jgi:uroporphyrin-III C-methyltransferase / precorrin-2 dehydrogenase / sirohydrochlorin ferrochelatase